MTHGHSGLHWTQMKTIAEKLPVFERTVLPNGVRVITETIPSVRSISAGVWIYTGSRDEEPEEAGLSHFIEHMVFKGTRRRRMHHIAQRMEAVGGYLNAFTSKEYTCYYARSLDEHLYRALDAVLDLALEPVIPPKEIEKEKDVVLEEMKMYEDQPEDLIFDRFEDIVYKDHALGRPIIGYADTVRSFTRDQIIEFLERTYAPNRIVVAVAGNAHHPDVVAMVEKAFARIERQPHPRAPRPINGYEPGQHVESRPTQQAHLVLGTRAVDVYDERRKSLTVLNTVLGGGMSSRLNQNIREKYGYCYSIYSFLNLHSDTGDFGVYMGTEESKIERSRKLIFREMERLVETPLSPRQLAQAKAQVKGSVMLGLENMSNRMMRLGRQEIYFEQYFTLDYVINEVDSVTAEEVQEIAREVFRPDQFSTVVLLPQN
jgi:predicted Zn-dependent peptidase